MLKPTKTKWHWSQFANAPAVSNNFGTLVEALDACLVDGYNLKAIENSVREDNTLTITVTNHGFRENQVITISGSSTTSFNREFRIDSVTTDTVKISLDDTFTENSPTGLASIKASPLGWERLYSSGGKRAYRSLSSESDRLILYVVDELDPLYKNSYAKYAKLCICTELNEDGTPGGTTHGQNYLNAYYNSTTTLTDSTLINGWYRWYYARNAVSTSDTTAPAAGNRLYYVIGDDKSFYLFVSPLATTSFSPYFFGDIKLLNTNNLQYTKTLLAATRTTHYVSTSFDMDTYESLGTSTNSYLTLFSFTNTQTSVWSKSAISKLYTTVQATSGVSESKLGDPSIYQEGALVTDVAIILGEDSKYHYVGTLPGSYWIADNVTSNYTAYSLFLNEKIDGSDKPYHILDFKHSTGGKLILDPTGDW